MQYILCELVKDVELAIEQISSSDIFINGFIKAFFIASFRKHPGEQGFIE